jgi:hypothetical protein
MWLLIACGDKQGITSFDTADLPQTVYQTLSPDPIWESEENAYTTGGSFVDIDNDGDLDIVVSEGNDMEPGFLRVYHNNSGQIETTASWSSAEVHFYGHLCVGDLNADGFSDVVVTRFIGDAGFSEPGGVEVFINQEGELSPIPDWELDGFYSFSCALGDMENDGDLDIALAIGEAYEHEPDYSMALRNTGTGEWELAWKGDIPRYSFDVAWVDTNHDGFLDLVFANAQSGHSVFLSNSGVLEESPHWIAQGGPFEGNTLDFGDLNSDGFVDLLFSDNNQLGGLGALSLFCGPDFDICWQNQGNEQMWSAVSLHDVDADGDLDILGGAWWGAVDVYENIDGLPQFTPSQTLGSDDMVVEALAWGAINPLSIENERVVGSGLIEIPRPAFAVEVYSGVLGDGYISGPTIDADIWYAPSDLLLTDWEPNQGNLVFQRVEVQSDL